MKYECKLYDPQEQLHYLVENKDDDRFVVYIGKTDDDLWSTPVFTVEYYRDGGTLLAYLTNGLVLYVPQQMIGPLHAAAKIAPCETKAQVTYRYEKALYDAYGDQSDIVCEPVPPAEEPVTKLNHAYYGAEDFDAPSARELVMISWKLNATEYVV